MEIIDEHCSGVLAFPQGLCCKHIAAACFLLYMTSRVSLLFFLSLLFALSLPRREKKMVSDFFEGTGRVIFVHSHNTLPLIYISAVH